MNGKALLIGDDSLCMDPLAVLLNKKLRMQVIQSPDGLKGYDLAVSRRPDLVVADCQSRIVGGIQVLEVLERKGFRVPVSVLLANDVSRARKVYTNADAYFEKPVSIFQMVPRLVGLLENARKRCA